MSRVLVIGFGNPLRRDDGFGWRVAEELQEKYQDPEVEIRACHQLTPELAEPIHRAQTVIFIDATVDENPAMLSVQSLEPDIRATASFSHHSTPRALLASAEALYGTRPSAAYLIWVGACDLGFGEDLSNSVAAMIPRAIEQVERICAQFVRVSVG